MEKNIYELSDERELADLNKELIKQLIKLADLYAAKADMAMRRCDRYQVYHLVSKEVATIRQAQRLERGIE